MAFKIRRGVLGTPDTMAHSNASQSIAPSFTPVTSPQIADSERQPSPHVGPTGVVRRGAGRASNEARAWLAVANVTPTGYRVGVFMANHSRYARAADRRRNVAPGEIFTYWPQAKIAAELGCSERQVSRGVRSLREAGALTVRQRVRPCEASYVWSRSVGSDVGSHVGSGVVSGRRVSYRTTYGTNYRTKYRSSSSFPQCSYRGTARRTQPAYPSDLPNMREHLASSLRTDLLSMPTAHRLANTTAEAEERRPRIRETMDA